MLLGAIPPPPCGVDVLVGVAVAGGPPAVGVRVGTTPTEVAELAVETAGSRA